MSERKVRIKIRVKRGGSTWTPPDQLGKIPFERRITPIKGGAAAGGCGKGADCKCDQDGDGIFGDIAKKVAGVAGNVAAKVAGWVAPKSISGKAQRLLDQYKDWNITGGTVCREPVIGIIEKIVRKLSSGNLPFDRIYHLYVVLALKSSTGQEVKLRLERNQTFEAAVASSKAKDVATVDVPEGVEGSACARLKVSGSGPTLASAMQNFETQAKARNPELGAWRYAALPSGSTPSNNCQDFALSFLKGSGMLTDGLQKFIKQDVANLLPSAVSKGQQAITDVAGAVGNLLGKGETSIEPDDLYA